MNLPRNGSLLANCLLVVAGIVVGGSLTWLNTGDSERAEHLSGSRSQGPLDARLSARDSARNNKSRTDGTPGGEALLQDARTETDARKRTEAMRRAGAEGAGQDLAEAIAAGVDLASERDKLDYHLGIIGRWADADPEAALDHAVAGFPAGQLRSEAIGIALNKWGSANPREAWLWAEEHLSGPLKERAMSDLVIGWTRRTPSAAAEWLTGTGLSSQPLYSAVGRTWAEQSPRDAAAWASLLPAGLPRQTAELAVAGEWALQDPAAAAAHFADDLSGENGANLAITLSDVWATTNPAETARWISELPSGSSRVQAAGALATIWAASDIDAAVSWSRSVEDPEMRAQVITHLGTTWGAIEPDRALGWLTSLPAAEAREGIRGAFYSWAGTDPIGLHEWIDSAPGDPLSDQGRRSLGDVLSATTMPSAMDLALGMSAPDERDQAAARFYREWRKTDHASAKEWLQGNLTSLPPSTQERLNMEQALPVVPR
jgi:hypothetical protein